MSRLNYVRHLNETRKYVNDELGAVEIQAYNKVADNTFPNLVPLLSGKYVDELPWNDTKSKEPFDEYAFIWKNFSRHGFRTLLAEDAPNGAIFNYLKAGFFKTPVDYYLRPFSIAVERYKPIWNNDHYCIGEKPETDVVLDYLKDFVREFKKDPHFAISFISRLTHDDINRASLADKSYLTFFKYLKKNGHLKNTFVFFLSDHGMRFGRIRRTYVGKLEERMPFLSVILPQAFKQRYPRETKNVYQNRHRLTTPFDVYATLIHILQLQNNIEISPPDFNGQRKISLFHEISPDRTCESASIWPHWCTCHNDIRVNFDDVFVKEAAILVVKSINNKLIKFYKKCATLELKTILEVVRSVRHSPSMSHGVEVTSTSSHDTIYQLQIMTSPGNALLEATVSHNVESGRMILAGPISRINKYGDQSVCIDDFELKKYCLCK